MKSMRICVLGPPGSGKGTVSEGLAKHFKIPHFSAGQLLREERDAKTTLGKKISSDLSKGNLVPNILSVQVVDQHVNTKKQFIIDGFPRSVEQIELSSLDFDLVLSLEISVETAIERLANRRVCPNCGESYHLLYLPPPMANHCACGGTLQRRADDEPKIIKHRFKVQHEEQGIPVANYYENKKILKRLDATPSPKEVIEAAITLVSQHFNIK